jgi:hypothetical protein
MSMTLFIPDAKNGWGFAKQALALILYIPCVVVGYFAANVILNYALEFGISLSFESMQYSLLQGGTVDLDNFKTMVMIFIALGGAITMMCASLILALPTGVMRALQGTEIDSGQNTAASNMDRSVGSAQGGSAASGQMYGVGGSRDFKTDSPHKDGHGEGNAGVASTVGKQNNNAMPANAGGGENGGLGRPDTARGLDDKVKK